MRTTLKISADLLAGVRADLARPHAHAFERVGFITAGACWQTDGTLLLIAARYAVVNDDHYEKNSKVGAQIGAGAFREVLQQAYSASHSVLHVHTHGRSGLPAFGHTDLISGSQFVPSFFSTVPAMPHGMLVLSDTHATGLVWRQANRRPDYLSRIVEVGASLKNIGGKQ